MQSIAVYQRHFL